MSNLKEEKAKGFTLEDVLKKIKEHTFSCMVAGGYCRDVFHGVAHKDIDIIMWNFHPKDFAEINLMNMLWTWLVDNVDAKNISQHDNPYGEEERINFVWHLPHHNADIICYNARTHHDVLGRFDCNLNQFYLPSTVPNFDDESEYQPSLSEKPVYWASTPLEQLVFLKDLSDERIKKMRDKHYSLYEAHWRSSNVEPVTYYGKRNQPDESLDSF